MRTLGAAPKSTTSTPYDRQGHGGPVPNGTLGAPPLACLYPRLGGRSGVCGEAGVEVHVVPAVGVEHGVS